MARLVSAAPVLPARDVARLLDHYRRLGFTVEAYKPDNPPPEYGYASRDGVDLHVTRWDEHDPLRTGGHVYLYVDDADALHARWSAAGVDGRFVAPTDADYGLREGAHVDPEGNLLRYGSWLPGHEPRTDPEFASAARRVGQQSNVHSTARSPAMATTDDASSGDASSSAASSNAEKPTEQWVTGDEPMTGPQQSYLHTLAQQAGEEPKDDLTKAEASEEIERLQRETGRGT